MTTLKSIKEKIYRKNLKIKFKIHIFDSLTIFNKINYIMKTRVLKPIGKSKDLLRHESKESKKIKVELKSKTKKQIEKKPKTVKKNEE